MPSPHCERKSDIRVRTADIVAMGNTPERRPVTGHPYPVPMTIPSMDTLKHISDRLKANDIAWFKDRFHAGEFSWLKEHLPEGGYTTLGERIEAGDLGHVRTLFRGLDLPGFGTLFGGGAVAAAAATGVAGVKGAAAFTSSDNNDRKKKGAVWILPVALLGAIALGFGLSRLGDNKNDNKVAAETTTVVEESVAPATELVADTAAVPAAEGDIIDTATANGSFTTLTAAIGAAGLTETLKGTGPFTVFAPTDDAFKALPAGLVDALLKPENKATLTKILTYHVVAGKVLAADIKAGDVPTVEGGPIKLATDASNNSVTVNDAKVVTADVPASNGVIHVIDKVLVPSDIDVAALLGGATAPTTTAPAPAAETIADLTTTNKAGDATPEDLTVYFASGSARFDAVAQAKIDGSVKILAAAPAGTKVALVGRADKTGDAAANLALSKGRAENVQAALVKGLADKAANITFTADAKGDEEQIDDLSFARRVTIEIAK